MTLGVFLDIKSLLVIFFYSNDDRFRKWVSLTYSYTAEGFVLENIARLALKIAKTIKSY